MNNTDVSCQLASVYSLHNLTNGAIRLKNVQSRTVVIVYILVHVDELLTTHYDLVMNAFTLRLTHSFVAATLSQKCFRER